MFRGKFGCNCSSFLKRSPKKQKVNGGWQDKEQQDPVVHSTQVS